MLLNMIWRLVSYNSSIRREKSSLGGSVFGSDRANFSPWQARKGMGLFRSHSITRFIILSA